MDDYLPILGAVLSGLFALVSAIIAWKLKIWTADRERAWSTKKEHRDALENLYVDAYTAIEEAMRAVHLGEKFDPTERGSAVNGRIHLLASEEVREKYFEVMGLLQKWSKLHFLAKPRQIQMENATVTVVQAPDPATKHQGPEREARQALQSALDAMMKEMHEELAKYGVTTKVL